MGKIEVRPLTADLWEAFEALAGPKGICAGCWCMYFRRRASEFNQGKGHDNKKTMQEIVASGKVPGLIAFADNEPVGWISVSPREDYPRLLGSRTLKPVDDQPVWSIVCFFVQKRFRRQGITKILLQAAVDYARQNGAKIIEGYPNDEAQNQPDVFVFTGLLSPFLHAGFAEAARRSPKRPIVRLLLKD